MVLPENVAKLSKYDKQVAVGNSEHGFSIFPRNAPLIAPSPCIINTWVISNSISRCCGSAYLSEKEKSHRYMSASIDNNPLPLQCKPPQEAALSLNAASIFSSSNLQLKWLHLKPLIKILFPLLPDISMTVVSTTSNPRSFLLNKESDVVDGALCLKALCYLYYKRPLQDHTLDT